MKKIYYIFFCVLSFFLLITYGFAKYNNNVLKGLVFVIDPGHGGKDAGTSYKKIEEKDLNLAISLKLKEELLKKGATVYLTRDGDYDLSFPNADRRKKSDFDNRINYINGAKADLYFSIHINYLNDSRYSGAQVFYDKEDEQLATYVQNSLNKEINSERSIKKISQFYYMYRYLNIPGLLIECGFISNPNERELLQKDEHQKKIAIGITKGIIDYYANKNN